MDEAMRPERVQERLDQLAGAAKEGLLQAIVAVVLEAYFNGVSTRKVDRPVGGPPARVDRAGAGPHDAGGVAPGRSGQALPRRCESAVRAWSASSGCPRSYALE
jgi:hypothetical protein